jgi:hypothetical protein
VCAVVCASHASQTTITSVEDLLTLLESVLRQSRAGKALAEGIARLVRRIIKEIGVLVHANVMSPWDRRRRERSKVLTFAGTEFLVRVGDAAGAVEGGEAVVSFLTSMEMCDWEDRLVRTRAGAIVTARECPKFRARWRLVIRLASLMRLENKNHDAVPYQFSYLLQYVGERRVVFVVTRIHLDSDRGLSPEAITEYLAPLGLATPGRTVKDAMASLCRLPRGRRLRCRACRLPSVVYGNAGHVSGPFFGTL